MTRAAAAACLAAALIAVEPAGGARVTFQDWRQGAGSESEGFVCPLICTECCQARKWLGMTTDDESFTCLMPTQSVKDFGAADMGKNHTCQAPKSDPHQAKTECTFAPDEVKKQAHSKLRPCTFDGARVTTYKDFIGSKPCSATGTVDFLNLQAIGTAIDQMYFTVDGLLTGVCVAKAKEFESNGMMAKVCAGQSKGCFAKVKEDLCNMLENDLEAKRLDKFSLAAWAASVGPMSPVRTFPMPEGAPKVLKKFAIPGWKARKVAYETLEGDKPIDLAGGGFQCMMSKMQALPVTDDLTDTENNYVDPEHPVPGQKAFYPRSPPDVLRDYFDKFLIYQSPRHFPVDPAELQTDATLTKLVFEAIGAHRIETVSAGGLLEPLAPIYMAGTLTPASSPHWQSLDEGARKAVRFALRLEGLFDDVPVRPGMAKWGGNAFFSGGGDLVALQYDGQTLVSPAFGGNAPPDAWGAHKFAFRGSLISTVTAFDHLVSTHILVSETLAMAAYETLPADHGLRLLLTPHTWGSLSINFKAANNLFPANMLVHRGTPFVANAFSPADGSDGLLWKKAVVLRYRPFKEAYAAYRRTRDALLAEGAQAPEVPFFEDGILLHAAINKYVQGSIAALYASPGLAGLACAGLLATDWDARKFVNRFFELNDEATKDFWPEDLRKATWSCESLVALLTECLFLVTGFHRHVGTVPDFFRDSSFAATAWKHGETRARPKHTMMAEMLAATTNADNPKLTTNITGMYQHHAALHTVAKEFAQSMVELQATVEQANKKRKAEGRLEFHQMEPNDIEWGVEV